MASWTEIKKKILFSYMGCDWTSIRVKNSNPGQINDILTNDLKPSESTGIYKLNIVNVEVFFYLDSTQHFDFDPKQVTNEDQWSGFLNFFKNLSKKLNSEILFRPEDSDYESDSSILINISGDNVTYNFAIENEYSDDKDYRM